MYEYIRECMNTLKNLKMLLAGALVLGASSVFAASASTPPSLSLDNHSKAPQESSVNSLIRANSVAQKDACKFFCQYQKQQTGGFTPVLDISVTNGFLV